MSTYSQLSLEDLTVGYIEMKLFHCYINTHHVVFTEIINLYIDVHAN